MMNRSLMQRLARWLAVAVLLGAALGAGLGAMAQAEPTLHTIATDEDLGTAFVRMATRRKLARR